jgi:hypothetical protein
MKVQIVSAYRVSHLQRYGFTVRGNNTSVYPFLVDCRRAWIVNSQPKRTNCHIYTLLPPDDGQLASPKHLEV